MQIDTSKTKELIFASPNSTNLLPLLTSSGVVERRRSPGPYILTSSQQKLANSFVFLNSERERDE